MGLKIVKVANLGQLARDIFRALNALAEIRNCSKLDWDMLFDHLLLGYMQNGVPLFNPTFTSPIL